jgi:hypothetical protein
MPNHFSDIGFDLNTESEFQELANQVYERGKRFRTGKGTYLYWSPGEGVELWGQLDQTNNFIGLNPHFVGESTMRVGLTAEVDRSESSPLDGAFYGWASPNNEDPESGHYPFVFDVPDFQLGKRAKLPCIADIQLAAFAHGLAAFESDDAYEAAHTEEPKFAAESFIPSGLFTPEGEATKPPQAYAIMTGYVIETAMRINPVAKAEFCWTRIRTYGGEFDVVADPTIVTGSIVKGGIVQGTFWLSGRRLNNDPERKAGLLHKLFG